MNSVQNMQINEDGVLLRYYGGEAVVTVPEGVTEIGTHPGIDEEWRRIDTDDCFENCKRISDELGIERITFNEL